MQHIEIGDFAMVGFLDIGALHTDTEIGFTGSGSPIQIQCNFMYNPHGMQTMCIALLDWILHTVMQHVA